MQSARQKYQINTMNEITTERGDDSGIESSNADSGDNSIYIRVSIPELKIQKCLQFHPEDSVWTAKERVLSMLSKEQLKDSLNYGLYCPPMNGRAGKFLDEERPLKDYPLPGPIGFLEFKYKRRVYKLMQINPRRLKQLHSKSNLKQFLDHVRKCDIDKINKMTIRGLDPNFHEHETGETPLSISSQVEKPRNLILALVGGGAHLDYRTRREGLTPLHRAAQRGNYEAIKTFLELGASPNYKDAHGLTALYHCVCHNTSPRCVELLLHDHSVVGVTDEQGWTEAHQACKHGRVQHLEPLLFYGADMNAQNSGGNTPLHVCAINNQEECARVLLFRGADKNILNAANQDAFQVAVISGNRELADVIKNFKPEDVVPFQELPRYNEKRRITISAATLYKLQRSRSDPRLNIIGRSQPSSPTTSSSSMPHFMANGMLFEPSNAGMLYENVMTKDDCVGSEASMSVSSGSSFTDSFTSDNGPMMRSVSCDILNVHNHDTSSTSHYSMPDWSSPLESRCVSAVSPCRLYVCTYPHLPKSHSELPLAKGDFVEVLSHGEAGYWEGKVGHCRGWFPSHCVQEVMVRSPDNYGLAQGDVHSTSMLNTPTRSEENTPRTVRLQKGRNGFGFVLRGAKSQNQATSTLDFKPTADFPALQYLDRVDHDSVADRAGLKAGDFVLEINGENVVNATHEHTVSLIKNSGDVLDMKVITVKPLTHEVLDQRHIHADGTRTLPYKKKEGLDRTLARYDTEADRQSLGNASDSFAMNNVPALRGVDQQNKTASISRRIKRLSSTPLEGIFERQGNEDISIDQSASRQPKPIVVGAQKVYASPQEARIKQNGGLNGSYSHHISHIDVRDGAPENHYSDVSSNIANVHLSSVPDHDKIYHNEHSSDGIYSVPYKHHQQGGLSVKISENSSGGGIPPRPTRPPPQTPPISGGRNVTIPPPPSHAPPATPHSTELGQVVPIQTHQHQYANVSEDIQRQRSGTDSDSSFESSFRPGNKAYVAKEPLGTPGQSTTHSRHSSGTSSLSSSTSNHGEYQLPNVSSSGGPVTTKSSHVVSADVHLSTPARAYEPEPDYDKQETTPKLAHGDIPSLRSLRDAKTTGSAVRTADVSKNNGSVEKTSTEINQTKSASGAAAVMHAQTASNSAEKTKSQQQVTSQKTKAPAPPPPANQPRSSSATPTTSTASTTPTVKQEENVMSAFGNAIKMAALAREKRALEAESGKTKAPAPPPPTSSGSIPPPPPGAPPPPPQITPATSTAAHGSPGLEKKPVPAHVQKQLEETRKREESHAALLAAVAKRRNVVESVDRENLADSIESRIQRSKKLQTVVYKSDQSKPEVKVTTPPAAPVLAKPPELTRSEEKSEGKTPENMANHINNNNVVKANSEEHSTPGHAELSETKSNTDFLAAAEKARQQYLQKKQQATLERKTPTKSPSVGSPAESPRAAADASANGRSPVKPGAGETKNQTTLSDLAHIIAEKALERQRSTGGVLENHNNNNAASAETSSNSSLTLSSDGSLNAVELHGATTDFSHTDTPLSSRTASFSGAKNDDDALLLPVSARKRIFEAKQTASSNKPAAKDYRTNNGLVKAVNKTNLAHRGPDSEGRDNGKIVHNGIAHLDDSRLVNGRADANTDFIPPPPLFDSSAAVDGRTRYVADDSISSMSSVSTLSSADHFDSPPASFSFDIVPPPPPPGFDDSPRTSTTDLTSSTEFIPPPMEFDSPAPPVSPLNGSLKNIQKSNQSHSISYPAMKTPPAGGQKSYQEKDIDKWSTADVASWLDNLQLSEHKDTFVKSRVTGQVLKLMDRNKLISLGVTQVGHRMAIERAIKKATIQ